MATTGWTISPTDGASINQSTGVASFSANTSTTEDKVYTITYTNDNGCTGSTTYTVKKSQPPTCQSAFTYSTVSGCLDWARCEVINGIVSAETESYTITGESKDCNGNYKEVTFSCAERPNTLWTADITHTGTSYTAKVYRKMGVYTIYTGMPAGLSNGQGKNYYFNICTNKLTIYMAPMIVDQDGRSISEWHYDNPTAYGVLLDSYIPLDESVTFSFKITTRGATTDKPSGCGSIGHKQNEGTVSVTIPSGSSQAYDTYPASAVAWIMPCDTNPSGFCPCFPPFEYYTREVAILQSLEPKTVETRKYIVKIR